MESLILSPLKYWDDLDLILPMVFPKQDCRYLNLCQIPILKACWLLYRTFIMQAYQVGAHFRRRFEPDNPIGRVVGIGLFRDLQHQVNLGELLFAARPIRA